VGHIYGCKLQIDFSCGAQSEEACNCPHFDPKAFIGCHWISVLSMGIRWISMLSLSSLGSQSFRYMLDSKALLGTCLLGITIEGYFHYHKSITSKVITS
jgi:hypothetical protein